MRPIELNLTITIPSDSADAFMELMGRAIERGTASCVRTLRESAKSPGPQQKPQVVERLVPTPRQSPPEDKDEPMLIDTHRAAKMLAVSPRKLWQMYNSGEMPTPIRIGRAVRWNHDELRAWVDAGCPPQDKWKRIWLGRE